MYDAQLAPFQAIDPKAEEFYFQSPYLYAYNNLIRFIDYLGMSGEEPPEGTAQIYVKLGGSFGPQLGFNIGDIISGTLRAANVKGETKVGVILVLKGKCLSCLISHLRMLIRSKKVINNYLIALQYRNP